MPGGAAEEDEAMMMMMMAAGGEEEAAAAALLVLGRKSVNTTECVTVPSSEHVAEIVGRQGCKIKALRAKTNTYIKTPVRGEEPVFVVTGRRQDVAAAKREILSAAEHFSLLRAARGRAGAAPAALPGQTTVRVRVPYRVVGLVVGPRGATIKRIQQQTHTYIVTPSRDREPVFEVTGMPENVDRARREIQTHIAARTGACPEPGDGSDFRANGTDVGPEGWPCARPAAGTGCAHRSRSSSSPGSASTDSFFSPASPFGPAGAFWFGDELLLDPPAYEPLPAPSPLLWAPLEPGPGGSGAPRGGSPPPTPPEGLEPPPGRPPWGGDPAGRGPPPGLPLCPPAFSSGTDSGSSSTSTGGSASSSPPESRRRGQGCPLCPQGRASPPESRQGCPLCPAGRASPPESRQGCPLCPQGRASPPESRQGCPLCPEGRASPPESCQGCPLCPEGRASAALLPCGHRGLCPRCARRVCACAMPACPLCCAAVSQAVQIHS